MMKLSDWLTVIKNKSLRDGEAPFDDWSLTYGRGKWTKDALRLTQERLKALETQQRMQQQMQQVQQQLQQQLQPFPGLDNLVPGFESVEWRTASATASGVMIPGGAAAWTTVPFPALMPNLSSDLSPEPAVELREEAMPDGTKAIKLHGKREIRLSGEI